MSPTAERETRPEVKTFAVLAIILTGYFMILLDNSVFELVAERGPAQTDLDPLFGALRPDPGSALDGVLDADNFPLEEEP